MRNNNYPDWVAIHLKPNIYANKTTKGYTLYQAHTIYDPIKKGPKRVYEKTLGTVTQAGGFVAAKPYHKRPSNLKIYRFGEYKVLHDLMILTLSQVPYNLKYLKNEIIVGALLSFINGSINIIDFDNSYLCLLYPKVRLNQVTGPQVSQEIARCVNKMKSLLTVDLTLFKYVYLLETNHHFTVYGLTPHLAKTAQAIGVLLAYD